MADDVRRDPNDPRPTDPDASRRRVAVYDDDDDRRPRERRYDRDDDLPATIKRISWGAIFAGTVIALVTQLGLNLLGASIGFGAIDPATEADPFSGLGTGTGIWLAITTIIALLIGGYVASRLAGMPDRTDGILHGVVTWGLVTLVTIYLMTSAVGRILNTATGVVGQGLQLAGQGVTAVAPAAAQEAEQQLEQRGISLDALVDDAINQVQQAVTGDAPENGSELDQAIQQLSEPGSDAADREAVVDLMVERTDMTEAEARQQVQQYQQQFQQARQQAQQTGQQFQQRATQIGDQVAAAMSSAALWAFIAMVVGAISAAIGGAIGVPRDLPASAAVRRE